VYLFQNERSSRNVDVWCLIISIMKKIMNLNKFGRQIRPQRRQHGLRQAEVAALAEGGTRFVPDIENGKSTLELGRAIRVANIVGPSMPVSRKSWTHSLAEDEI
jgi:HTH-type transcriptional regulator / antitoxin HipB